MYLCNVRYSYSLHVQLYMSTTVRFIHVAYTYMYNLRYSYSLHVQCTSFMYNVHYSLMQNHEMYLFIYPACTIVHCTRYLFVKPTQCTLLIEATCSKIKTARFLSTLEFGHAALFPFPIPVSRAGCIEQSDWL